MNRISELEKHREFYQCFSARLRILRKERGWSQEQTAKRLGVDRTSYADYERSRIMPSLYMVRSIARLYGVTTDMLLENDGVDDSDPPMPLDDVSSLLKGK